MRLFIYRGRLIKWNSKNTGNPSRSRWLYWSLCIWWFYSPNYCTSTNSNTCSRLGKKRGSASDLNTTSFRLISQREWFNDVKAPFVLFSRNEPKVFDLSAVSDSCCLSVESSSMSTYRSIRLAEDVTNKQGNQINWNEKTEPSSIGLLYSTNPLKQKLDTRWPFFFVVVICSSSARTTFTYKIELEHDCISSSFGGITFHAFHERRRNKKKTNRDEGEKRHSIKRRNLMREKWGQNKNNFNQQRPQKIWRISPRPRSSGSCPLADGRNVTKSVKKFYFRKSVCVREALWCNDAGAVQKIQNRGGGGFCWF